MFDIFGVKKGARSSGKYSARSAQRLAEVRGERQTSSFIGNPEGEGDVVYVTVKFFLDKTPGGLHGVPAVRSEQFKSKPKLETIVEVEKDSTGTSTAALKLGTGKRNTRMFRPAAVVLFVMMFWVLTIKSVSAHQPSTTTITVCGIAATWIGGEVLQARKCVFCWVRGEPPHTDCPEVMLLLVGGFAFLAILLGFLRLHGQEKESIVVREHHGAGGERDHIVNMEPNNMPPGPNDTFRTPMNENTGTGVPRQRRNSSEERKKAKMMEQQKAQRSGFPVESVHEAG
ncbi:uncharacterized protein LOC129596244 [Paramacrobiotus metropolitanus]|uniref:uncharacterized protein LOC129596244 n=1 Tax=Paramacrobiotus metropolitanus TaxID=2943436 RepID=UPI00244641FE|nr:uncharacterized protein LOC129596244 [Paramacrobiotus metropolitanus]